MFFSSFAVSACGVAACADSSVFASTVTVTSSMGLTCCWGPSRSCGGGGVFRIVERRYIAVNAC